MTFTFKQKLEAVEREIKLRKRVYPRWVQDKRMSQPEADRQIAVFEEIREDYERAEKTERLI
jgi:hypothetical protein